MGNSYKTPIEYLKSLGLADSEVKYLTTPLIELDQGGRGAAIAARDRKTHLIEQENSKFIPAPYKPRRMRTVGWQTDSMDGVRNPVDGKMYDSKSRLRRSYRENGVIEVGNEPIPTKPRETVGDFDCRKEVAQAIEQTGFMEKRKKK